MRYAKLSNCSIALPKHPETPAYSISRVRAFAVFGDETVDPRRDNSESIREQAAAVPSRARARATAV